LWTAAGTLRANSNYASNEYFLPVMGLVFLRHAYSRYLGVKDAIEANLPKRGGKVRALTKETSPSKAPSSCSRRRSSTPWSRSPTGTG
jgi:type I restriction enzyme M protein